MKMLKKNQLAKELRISKSYLSMILSGQRKCPEELVAKISSQIPVNCKAKLCLEGRNSSSELLPQNRIYVNSMINTCKAFALIQYVSEM